MLATAGHSFVSFMPLIQSLTTAGETAQPCGSVQSVLPSTQKRSSSRKRHAVQRYRITTLKASREHKRLVWGGLGVGNRIKEL